jgi:hypothetical protein
MNDTLACIWIDIYIPFPFRIKLEFIVGGVIVKQWCRFVSLLSFSLSGIKSRLVVVRSLFNPGQVYVSGTIIHTSPTMRIPPKVLMHQIPLRTTVRSARWFWLTGQMNSCSPVMILTPPWPSWEFSVPCQDSELAWITYVCWEQLHGDVGPMSF